MPTACCRFRGFVTIEDNEASVIGGGMWVADAATVDFRRPFRVNISGNTARSPVSALRRSGGLNKLRKKARALRRKIYYRGFTIHSYSALSAKRVYCRKKGMLKDSCLTTVAPKSELRKSRYCRVEG